MQHKSEHFYSDVHYRKLDWKTRQISEVTTICKSIPHNGLLVFERKILRRIFGPTKENQMWRVKTNGELYKLIKHKNIINYIKAQRLSLLMYKGCQNS